MADVADDARRAAERAARQSYGKLVAHLAARTGDVATAEDALADAFAAALRYWPVHGVPQSPQAWLVVTARRRLIDRARSQRTAAAAAPDLLRIIEEADTLDEAAIPDARLRLMFVCAHPAIDMAVRGPLMLQTVLGLDASIIAESFLTSPAAMSQRLVRAKRRIRETGIPFRLPERADLPERLDAVLNAIYAAFATCRLDDSIDQLAVLNAIYAAFATGWADPVGLDARRHGLVEEAIWLGRVAVDLLPQEPETLGLLALMLHAQARRSARRDGDGAYIPLSQQDTACWDGGAIEEAEGLLRAASALAREPKAIGRFQLEAAVQSAHAARRIAGRTDWQAIVALYDGLVALTGSPIVAVNRAAAMAESESAEAGLAALDGLMPEPKLAGYQPYWALRADLLARLGHNRDAEAAYVRALALESNPAVRRYLEARRDGLPTGP